MVVYIRPEETRTLRRIPRSLLFRAPGLPKGHLLMGYDDKGHCPMLIGGRCSIYEDRPQTCRDYDCRVFAATGISTGLPAWDEIAQRAGSWTFSYKNEESEAEHAVLKEAAAFLQRARNLFPPRTLPAQPGPLAAFAVKIYRAFADLTAEAESKGKVLANVPLEAEAAEKIVAALHRSIKPPVPDRVPELREPLKPRRERNRRPSVAR